jgi:hypothetical protein
VTLALDEFDISKGFLGAGNVKIVGESGEISGFKGFVDSSASVGGYFSGFFFVALLPAGAQGVVFQA